MGKHPVIAIFIVLALGIIGVLAWMYADARREFRSDVVASTLTEMHRQMFSLATKKVAKGKNTNWIRSAVPVLCYKWRIVELGQYKKWQSRIQSRFKQALPKNDRENPASYLKAIGVADKIKQEIMSSREWGIDDLVKIGEWLDEQGKGVGTIRDSDTWSQLNNRLRDYRIDDQLKTLIKTYQTYSYAFCSIYVAEQILLRERRNPVANTLLTVLMGMPFSKHQISEGLEEVLDGVRTRMRELRGQTSSHSIKIGGEL